jgi:hypothetical protein
MKSFIESSNTLIPSPKLLFLSYTHFRNRCSHHLLTCRIVALLNTHFDLRFHARSLDMSSLDISSLDISSLDISSLDISSLDISSLDISSLDMSSPRQTHQSLIDNTGSAASLDRVKKDPLRQVQLQQPHTSTVIRLAGMSVQAWRSAP